ncbi:MULTISPECIES: hypothetical protein [unclassified Sphingomonas]|uniref:hypothetical protein n=1 Tax=unclassified Sphingomonas TaxID=196159 RepID=UPI000AD2FAB7|nr:MULTISPECIES: hypothetical protein [unclassified Sphingomonas]
MSNIPACVGLSVLSGPPTLAQALEPSTQGFVGVLVRAAPIDTLPVADARNGLAGTQKSVDVKLAPAMAQDRVLNVGPIGTGINLRADGGMALL